MVVAWGEDWAVAHIPSFFFLEKQTSPRPRIFVNGTDIRLQFVVKECAGNGVSERATEACDCMRKQVRGRLGRSPR